MGSEAEIGWGREGCRVESMCWQRKGLNKILYGKLGSPPEAEGQSNLASLSLSVQDFKAWDTQAMRLCGVFPTLTLFTHGLFPGDNFLSKPIKVKAEIFRVCSCPFRIHVSKKNNHISFFM